VPCSTAVADAPFLEQAQTHLFFNLLYPFGVVFAPGGSQLFVSGTANSVQPHGYAPFSAILELSVSGAGLTQERVVPVHSAQQLLGEAESPNGKYLVTASGSGVDVFSISDIEDPGAPSASAMLGQFTSAGQGAIEAIVSPDGNYVFVSLEDSHAIAVFDLGEAVTHGFGRADLVGYIPTGLSPVGLAISPNGRYLFATSEVNSQTENEGTLTTVDLDEAERDPSRSIVSTVWAGCGPVRVVADSQNVYVSARESDEVLDFSEHSLAADPGYALVAQVEVGEAPVGLALVDHDRKIVVGNSNRFNQQGASSSLAVVDVSPAGGLGLAGYLPAGGFPRDMALSPSGNYLVVVNFASGQLEVVDTGSL
jgi:DNA-binding beta-propeller fold protein YncE